MFLESILDQQRKGVIVETAGKMWMGSVEDISVLISEWKDNPCLEKVNTAN